MDFGMTIPNYGPLARRDAIAAIARQAETLGFSMMAIADHIVIPKTWSSFYPYSPTGRIDTFDGGDCLEPLALMAALALATEKAQLLTAVLVVPYRPPILTAKQLATIDVLSEGRVTVGCGTGWMREEFEAIGAPPYEARGQVTDEYIEAFRAMWTSDEPTYEGEHARVADIYFRPQPVRKPHPPIWIGGDSMPALRRTARLGDGWLPVGLAPKRPLNTVARYRDQARHPRRRQPPRIIFNFAGAAPDGAPRRRLVAGWPRAETPAQHGRALPGRRGDPRRRPRARRRSRPGRDRAHLLGGLV